jgi:two-component system osmolarity sensor histidine kinase EnvZ
MQKRFLPRALLPRMLLIIIVPTMIAQVISTFIFYEKHWDHISKYIMYTLSNEISMVVNTHTSLPEAKYRKINKYTFLRYDFIANKKVKKAGPDQKLPKEIRVLKTNIEYNLPNKVINIDYNKKTKEVEITVGPVSNGALSFKINHKKIFIKSTFSFIVWMIGSSLLLLLITILFAKNQIKSITRLSKVANRLSRGLKVQRFIPHGAREVRDAGHAFLKMKDTIEEEVRRKSEMLAWVSHDLRTPLTRMKLQLALGIDNEQSVALKADIHQMEKIISDYLDFAKGDTELKTKLVNLSELLKEIVKTSQIGSSVVFETDIRNRIFVKINEHQIKRALFNLIDNAKRFGSKLLIMLYKAPTGIIAIEIHDNGPGIPEAEINNVFKPFYRGDNYKNQRANGVGLGIPIANNIIRNHRGKINFSKSQLGGLMITILMKTKAEELVE